MSLDVVIKGILTTAFVASVIRVSTPLILPAVGGLISDLAGVINIGLEGIMLLAAFVGVVVSAVSPDWIPGLPLWAYAWIGCFAGVLAGLLLAYILAVFHLEFGADIILSGIAINIMADGATVFLMYTITKAVAGIGDKGNTSTLASPAVPSIHIPIIENIPVLGEVLSGYNFLTYFAFVLVILAWYLLYRMPLGAHIRAVGENAEAAASVGIDVKRVRYIAILMSGFTAALGGINLSMGYLTLFQAKMTNGRGFIAIAAWYLGGRNPVGTLIACLIFGLADALSNQFASLEIPPQFMQMIPYVVTILALVLYNVRRRTIMIQRAKEFQERMTAEAEA